MSNEMKRWHWHHVAEINWRTWGLGFELSLCDWHPPEISVYINVGPIVLGFGLEENHEWRYPHDPS